MTPSRAASLILLLAGAACATAGGPPTPKPPDQYTLKDGTQVVCRMEASVGTHIRERVCRRVEGTSPTQQNAINDFLKPPGTNTVTGN